MAETERNLPINFLPGQSKELSTSSLSSSSSVDDIKEPLSKKIKIDDGSDQSSSILSNQTTSLLSSSGSAAEPKNIGMAENAICEPRMTPANTPQAINTICERRMTPANTPQAINTICERRMTPANTPQKIAKFGQGSAQLVPSNGNTVSSQLGLMSRLGLWLHSGVGAVVPNFMRVANPDLGRRWTLVVRRKRIGDHCEEVEETATMEFGSNEAALRFVAAGIPQGFTWEIFHPPTSAL